MPIREKEKEKEKEREKFSNKPLTCQFRLQLPFLQPNNTKSNERKISESVVVIVASKED
jgi:hypothetical protein